MTTDKPQFSVDELLKAAVMAGIDPAQIPSDATPWTWKDSRAMSWKTAFAALNPRLSQQAEVAYGAPLSLALKAALEGVSPMTSDLSAELAVKRPHQAAEMTRQQVQNALERMESSIKEERARRAELTPSPEERHRQLVASKEAAAAHLRSQHSLGELLGQPKADY